MAVVVQQMVFPQAAGILFTADPVTGNRKVASVEAGFGLGEALVSGLVNADVYKVRDGEVVAKAVTAKKLAVHASPAGGTQEEAIGPERQEQPALTDAQVVRLVQLGRRIEAHFGRPQDIEWCLVDDGFQIVQSRPITTLFPIPESGDRENHVYVSVGHQQMMTDPMKPLGLSFWQMTTPAPMAEAGGRLFVDVTQRLASPTSRAGLLEVLGRSDPLIGDALQTILERGDFVPSLPDEAPAGPPAGGAPAPIETDPAIVTELIRCSEASIAASERDIRTKSGLALDLTGDRATFDGLDAGAQAGMVWIFAHRFHAEFNVARLLAPFLLAAPDYEMQLLLATQVADEHRHLQAVLRIYEEVFGVEGGLEAVRELADWNIDPVAETLYGRLEHYVGRLEGDRGEDAFLAAVVAYHLLAEGWWRGRRRTLPPPSTSGSRSRGWPRGSGWWPATRRATSGSASPTPAGASRPTPSVPGR